MANRDLIEQIDAALAAHAKWKFKLTGAINIGHCDQTPDQIGCDDQCAFGKWLYGPTFGDRLKARKPYQVTKRLHADFHTAASRVAQLALDGRKGEAFAAMDSDYAVKSEKLTRALHKWRGELTD